VAGGDQGATSEEVNRLIAKHARPGVKFTLEDVRGHRAVAVGLSSRVGVVVDGEAGDFLAAFNAGAMVVAKGSVGRCLGYGMTAGAVQVVGSAGEGAGAYLHGGALHIFGDAGAFAGMRMAGGELVVKDNAKEGAGAGMAGGELAVLGAALGTVGAGMSGGAIFARAGTTFDSACAHSSKLDPQGAARLKALAAAVKVAAIEPSEYVRIAALADAGPAPGGEGATAAAHVKVSGAGASPPSPRVTVSKGGADPPGGALP